MEPPLVSIIIAAYRQPDFLNAALHSVAAQTYPNIEIIVVDDSSGEEFTSKYLLPQNAKLIIHPTRHATAAISRNTGLRHATGKYIALLDQDDLWQPEKIAIQVAALEANPAALLHFTHVTEVTEELIPLPKQKRPTRLKNPLRQFLIRNFLRTPSQVLIPGVLFDTVGLFDESIRGASDWDMWLRAAAAGPILSDPRPLTLYRHHQHQWSKSNLMMAKACESVMAKSHRLEKSHPELRHLANRRHARWLRELARIQIHGRTELHTTMHHLRHAVRLWPLCFRAYFLMFRLLLLKRPIALTTQAKPTSR